MFARKAFFSVMGVSDPTKHRTYNQYHQLDHRPENLLLPGVAWGDRWVRSPDCLEASSGSDRNYDDAQYAAMYWFRDPLDQSLKDWKDLGERGYQWGRRPDLAWRKNHLQRFYDPMKGYVAPRVLVSDEALPFRPVRGVHLTVSHFLTHDDHATHEAMAWYDRVRFPDLLECRGVAGMWTFVTEELFPANRDSTNAYTDRRWERLTLIYLDEDPLEVVAGIEDRERVWRTAGRTRDLSDVEDVVLSTPLRTIIPWEWDWFDAK
jgi:hypothetical protein